MDSETTGSGVTAPVIPPSGGQDAPVGSVLSENVMPPTPAVQQPKVIDLVGGDNSSPGGGFFRKKLFLAGALAVLVLALVGVGVGWYAVQQKVPPPPKAAGCNDFKVLDDFAGSTGANQDRAWAEGTVVNNCSTPVTVYLIKSWCKFVDLATNGGCGANTKTRQVQIPPRTRVHVSRSDAEQLVGDNGKCGSAQVDISFTPNASGPKDRGTTAFLAACQYKVCEKTTQACKSQDCPVGKACNDECGANKDCVFAAPLVCKSVTMTGGTAEVKKGGENRTLTVNASGGVGALTFSWKAVADTGDAGNLSAGAGRTVVWTAPSSLATAQKWTITVTATDTKGKTDSSGCVQNLSFATLPTFKHNVCQSNACILVDCSPNTASCSKSTDCQSDADCALPATYTFKTCQSNACVTKDCSPKTTPCAKSTDCQNDNDCKPQTHKECRSSSCVSVSGAGSDSCSVDGDCVQATHKTCQNNTCVSVDGAGTSTCSSDGDCAVAVTHKACQNNACVTVSGGGSSSCGADSDCVVAVATHRACQNNACVTVSGAGADQCTSDVSCRPAATPPAIPKSGNTLMTVGGLVLGAGSLLVGLLLLL